MPAIPSRHLTLAALTAPTPQITERDPEHAHEHAPSLPQMQLRGKTADFPAIAGRIKPDRELWVLTPAYTLYDSVTESRVGADNKDSGG